MLEWLAEPGVYNIIKALHVIAIIAWMAGIFYLPRLFVYHAGVAPESETSALFKVMERRLLRIIMNPAMIIAWIMGLTMLAANPGLLHLGWMHVKLSCVILLTAVHHIYVRFYKSFARDENRNSARFYRLWNEAPTLLVVIIVLMAVAEPF